METEISSEVRSSKSNIIFWIIFFLILFGSVAFTYYRIVVKRDYLISAETECDPYMEKCFIYECDPATEECTGDPEEDTWYYKLVKKKAFNIPNCDPNTDEECIIGCDEGEANCSYELCEEGNEGEIECVDPVQYAIDNPEEEEECAEDDEDPSADEAGCLAEAEEESEESEEAESEEASSEEDSEEIEVPIDISKWSTFRSQDCRFAIKYPKDWEVIPSAGLCGILKSPNYAAITSGSTEFKGEFYFNLIPNPNNSTIEDLMKSFNDSSGLWIGKFPYQKMTIGGYSGIYFLDVNEGSFHQKTMFLKDIRNKKVLNASYNFVEENTNISKIFDKIMGTIFFF